MLVAIELALGSFVIGNVVVQTVSTTLEAVGFQVYGRPAVTLFLSVVLLQGVTFGGIALAYLKLRDLGWSFIRARVPSLRGFAVTLGGLLLLIAILVVTSVVLSSLGIGSVQNQIVTIGNQNPSVFLLLIPLSFLLVGPVRNSCFGDSFRGRSRSRFIQLKRSSSPAHSSPVFTSFRSLKRGGSFTSGLSSRSLSCSGASTSTQTTSSCRHSFTVRTTPSSSVGRISRQLVNCG